MKKMTKQEYEKYIEEENKKETEEYKEWIVFWLQLPSARFWLDKLSKSNLVLLYRAIKKQVIRFRRLESKIKELEKEKKGG